MADSAPTEEEVKKARKAYDKAAKDTEKASAAAAKEKGKVTGMEEALLRQIAVLPEAGDLARAEATARDAVLRLSDAVAELEIRIQKNAREQERKNQLDTQIPRMERELAELEERYAEAKTQMASASASCEALSEQIAAFMTKLTFDSKKTAEAHRRTLEQERKALQTALETAEKNHAACREQLTALRASVAQLQKQLDGSVEMDSQKYLDRKQELSTQKSAILKAQKAVHSRLTANRANHKNIQSKFETLAELEEKQKWLRALSDTANGTIKGKEKIMLETYIQTTYFDRIVARANVRLMKMTGGQYDLKRRKTADTMRGQTGLELDVIDHYNGTERSVKTLSGGESFKASLALALGLSDEIQMSTGIRLDTLFVDEGFGSLDPESLNQAYNTLAGLTEGNRLVGIISHVNELKERIDKQIVVTKEKSGGSKAVICV